MACKNQISLYLFFVLAPLIADAQCIDSKTLIQQLLSSRTTSLLPPDKQLQQLLKYETVAAGCPYRIDSSRIMLLQRISKLFVETGQYVKSMQYTIQAIGIIDNNIQSPAINPVHQLKNYYQLASVYDTLNRTTEKIRAYDSCIAIGRRLNVVNVYLLYSLLEKVKYLNNTGEFELCVRRADLGETLTRRYVTGNTRQGYDDSIGYSQAFALEKANALMVLERPAEVESLLLPKVASFSKHQNKTYLGVLNEQVALAKMQQGDKKEALKYFKAALKQYTFQQDTLSIKVNIHNIGFLFEKNFKDDNKALYYYIKAKSIKVFGPDRGKIDTINSVNLYANLASFYARRGKFDSAHFYFQDAFNLIKKGTNEMEILQSSLDDFIRNQKVEYLTGLYIGKGTALYQQYVALKDPLYIQRALSMFRTTDLLLERIKWNQVEIKSKLFWRKITHPFYENAIKACIESGNTEEAFYFFERSRAILLYDQIKEQRGFDKAGILEQQNLRNNIRNLQQKLAGKNPYSPEFKELQEQLSDLQDKQNYLLQQIKARNPLYFKNFLDTSFTSLPQIRRSILKDHSLLEIFEGDSIVFAMVVTARNIYLNRINKADYDSAINQCLLYISDPDKANIARYFKVFINNSRRLYQLIFQGKKVPEGKIIISTDGRNFPFETLVTDVVNNVPVYFIEHHPVSYTYSARYLMNQFTIRPSFTPGNFLGIAPVTFPVKGRLPVLPGSDIAVKNLAALFPVSNTLLSEKASRGHFLSNFSRYQVVQLYSHSSDSSSRGEPVIYFADEPLYLSELNTIDTPATRLVVLSACETGKGAFFKGEGVFSFNRAFAALGIPSCVNNLWSVDNHSTYKITELFYKQIARGVPVDVSLQQAKLEYIKTSTPRMQMPYYWAAIVLSGKTEGIPLKKINYTLVISALAGLVVITGAVFLRVKEII